MTAEEMWKEYARKVGIEHSDYEAWAFGDAADELAALTVEGKRLPLLRPIMTLFLAGNGIIAS